MLKGQAFGSERGWANMFVPHAGNRMRPGMLGLAGDHMNYLFYEHDPGPEFDWRQFDIDDVTAGKGAFMMAITDATDPDLTRFLKDRGGRLILYQGWTDPLVRPEPTLDHYQAIVARTFGGDVNAARERVRLFMAPGMDHCGGGAGPNAWDRLAPLVDWVEHGRAPDYLVAVHRTDGKVDNERKICDPQRAAYVGPPGGGNDRANWIEKNFMCR